MKQVLLRRLLMLVMVVFCGVASAHQPPQGIQTLFFGQSNAERIDPNDLAYFDNQYVTESGFSSYSIVSAFSGSALLKTNASKPNDLDVEPTNFWVQKVGENADGTGKFAAGPRLLDTLKAGINPSLAVWIQGEQDGTKIKNSSEKDDYKEALSYVFTRIKNTLGNDETVFGIVVTGRRLRTNTSNRNKLQFVRQAQHELSELRDDVFVISDAYDIDIVFEPNTSTDAHYTDKGRKKVLDRIANSAVSYFGKSESFLSIPKIESVALNLNNKKELLVEISGAQKLVKGGNSNGLFSAHLGGKRIEVSASRKISDSLIILTMASAINQSYVLHVGNGELIGIESDGSKRIRNENFLPISSGRFAIHSSRW